MKVSEIRRRLLRKVPAFTKKIAPAYLALNWEWGTMKGGLSVPGAKEIASTLRRLIRQANFTIPGGGTYTGGLYAGLDEHGNGVVCFKVNEVLYL